MGHAAPVDGSGRLVRWHQSLMTTELRVIDAVSGFLQRLRKRVDAAPVDDEASDDGRRRLRSDSRDAAVPEAALVVLPRPRRLSYFLIFAVALMIGAVSGAAFSYRLLAKMVESNATIIEYLRDEVAGLEKQDAINMKERAKHQRVIQEYDKEIAGYREEIEGYKTQVDELQSQLSAIKTPRQEPAASASDVRGGAATAMPGKRSLPQKTGTCTTGAANTAADLARCVAEFNRK